MATSVSNTKTAFNLLKTNQINWNQILASLGFSKTTITQLKIDFEKQLSPILEQYEALKTSLIRLKSA